MLCQDFVWNREHVEEKKHEYAGSTQIGSTVVKRVWLEGSRAEGPSLGFGIRALSHPDNCEGGNRLKKN